MGIQLGKSVQELFQLDDYKLQVVRSEMDHKTNKVRVLFRILAGLKTGTLYAGRELGRRFNPLLSARSGLGGLVVACGIDFEAMGGGEKMDLDAINGTILYATLEHWIPPQGTSPINSLGGWRKCDAGAAPVTAPAAQAAAAPPVTAPAAQPAATAPAATPPAAVTPPVAATLPVAAPAAVPPAAQTGNPAPAQKLQF